MTAPTTEIRQGLPLATDHKGTRVDYSGLLTQACRELKHNAPFRAEGLRQLQNHIKELGTRYYSGDQAAVDEFLQLYSVERQARARAIETGGTSVVPSDGWLIDDGLVYRLTDDWQPQNRDEINVTMADGSRSIDSRGRRARELLDRIRASNHSTQQVDEGRLWSLMRDVLKCGEHLADRHRSDGREVLSAHVDSVANEFTQRILEMISATRACVFASATNLDASTCNLCQGTGTLSVGQKCICRFGAAPTSDKQCGRVPMVDPERYFPVEFEVWQGDELQASASGPREMALAEAMNYAAQYGQDGPVRVFEVERHLIQITQSSEGGNHGA